MRYEDHTKLQQLFFKVDKDNNIIDFKGRIWMQSSEYKEYFGWVYSGLTHSEYIDLAKRIKKLNEI
jgi:hypothetical protein